MNNNNHITIKNIAKKILEKYTTIRIKEKSEWEKEFDKWLKTSKK
jgi:hypothetical protein